MASYIMPLILVPYISRTIGVERYGISEFSLELAAFFGTILLYGFDFTLSKRLSRNRTNKKYFSGLFWNVLYTRIFISLALIPLFWVIGLYFLDELFTKSLLLFSFLFLISRLFSSWWFFQGMEKITWIAIANFLIKAITLFIVLTVVNEPDDYPYVVFAFGLSQLFINVVAWLWIIYKFNIKSTSFQFKNVIQLLKYSFFTFLNEFLIMCFTTLNIIIVKYYLSPEELGLYAASIKVVIITQNFFIQSLSKSLFPNLALQFKTNKKEYYKKLIKFRNLLGLILIFVGLVILYAKEIIVHFLFGSNFQEVASLLVYISFLPFLIGMSNIYGWQGLYLLNKERNMSFISLFVGVFSICCLVMFTESFGVKGVLIIRNISELIIVLTASYFFNKTWKTHKKSLH